ncbi:MAG: hypothetical protein IKS55_06770 [Oscillospiraceae bacterium]|nr:hypothetical protein [Oscillospiraceae bacterium]
MKKTVFAFLIAFVLLLGAGTAFASAEEPAVFSPDGSVIFEKDGVKVTTAGLDDDPTVEGKYPIIWLNIENTGSRDVCLGVTNGSVNGFMTDVLLIRYTVDEGGYSGADYCFSLMIPAGSSNRYALGYYKINAPGVKDDVLGEMSFCFTEAKDEESWPDYYSDPVTIATGEEVENADIASLGTVVLDDEKLRLVFGEQDYDDWFGPEVCVYAENKTESFIGIGADSAEADGVACDYIYYGTTLAPGKMSANFMAFDGEIQRLKGFENLSVCFSIREAATRDEAEAMQNDVKIDPVSVQYPPQIWGEYENGGLKLEIQPKYNDLLSVQTPVDDPDGILFTVSETASLMAGSYEGAGWLFSVGTVSADQLHEMLCRDMSGVEVIAKSEDGGYYMYYHPTDVRYVRATTEEMFRDQDQWSMLCEWAADVRDSFAEKNGLEQAGFGNSELDMLVARAAWSDDANATLSTTEFGPASVKGTDGTRYAEFVLQGGFFENDDDKAPDGEYVVLNLPEEDMRVDFFFAPDAYARIVSGDHETLYQAMMVDDSVSYAEAMQSWYYDACRLAGIDAPDQKLTLP